MNAPLTAALASYSKPKHFLQNVFALTGEGMRTPLIYMRNHKAACTSIILSLSQRRVRFDGQSVDAYDITDLHRSTLTGFRDVRQLGNEACFDLIQAPDTFTFSFVRHPLQRAASAFADKVTNSLRHRHKIARKMGKTIEDTITFPEFIEILIEDPDALGLDRHWRPQQKELAVDVIRYDFIGAIENLGRDLPAIMNFGFGTEEDQIADARATFGHKTSSRDLIKGLSTDLKRRFESVMSADYNLYEEALSTEFKGV